MDQRLTKDEERPHECLEKLSHVNLNDFFKERSQSILSNYEIEVTNGIDDDELRSILLEFAKQWQWQDTFRPTITSLCCEAVGGQDEAAHKAALVFNIMASGIGVHDDIIDNSSVNHSIKTIYGKYGLSKALLVGDLLIVKALALLFDSSVQMQQGKEKALDIIRVYRNLCFEFCEAEFEENSLNKKLETNPDYQLKVLWKEMAELEACTRIGAMIGDGKKNEVKALAEYGRHLGLIGRLCDEKKDAFNLEGNLPHRLKFESIPLPIVFAAHSSEAEFKKIDFIIKKIIKKTYITLKDKKELLISCFENGAFKYIYAEGKKCRDRAMLNLETLKPSVARNFLNLVVNKCYFNLTAPIYDESSD